MAITELGADRLEEPVEAEIEADVEERPAGHDSPPPARPAVWAGPLSGRWALVLTVAWVAIFTIGAALEPTPADENALPLLGAVLMSGLMTGWVIMAAGFAQRRRYGAMGSLGAAGVLVAMTIACPLSGHHVGIGAWWWFEVTGSVALVGASGAALRSS